VGEEEKEEKGDEAVEILGERGEKRGGERSISIEIRSPALK